jgi:hypothetical protein
MQVSGWMFMGVSWVLILGILFFCFSRIFKKGI